MVVCSHYKKELPALEAPPFPGPLGELVFAQVSQEAWDEWKEMQIKIINEYHLDLSEEKDRRRLSEQMHNFLGLSDTQNVLKVGTPS